MDILMQHFKLKEFQERLTELSLSQKQLQIEYINLEKTLISDANMLSSILCQQLQINKSEYMIAQLLNINVKTNYEAIKLWVLQQFINVGYPYTKLSASELNQQLEITLNRQVLDYQ